MYMYREVVKLTTCKEHFLFIVAVLIYTSRMLTECAL